MAVKKKSLGRGLNSLISDERIIEDNLVQKETVAKLKISDIFPNKNQPRIDFKDDSLRELGDSIKEHGLIQPIIVRKSGNKYELIAGERRWRASKLIGEKEINSIVIDIDDSLSAKYALIENIQRDDLNPIEEALGYKKLIDDFALTQEGLSKEVGKSRPYISNSLRLLSLEKTVIDHIANGVLSPGHGKVLLGIKDLNEQKNLSERIVKEGLNVRQTEDLLKEKQVIKKPKRIPLSKEPLIIDLEENLMEILGTRVSLVQGNKKGKIEIEYYSMEDLERIIEILKGENNGF